MAGWPAPRPLLGLFVVAIVGLAVLTIGVVGDTGLARHDPAWNEQLHAFGQQNAGLRQLLQVATHLGDKRFLGGLNLVLAVLAWRRFGPVAAIGWLTLVAGTAVLTSVMKEGIDRPRPPYAAGIESSPSFPSGHSSGAMACYGTLALLLARRRPLAALALAGLTGLIGVSRLILGVHYPSDVLAGFSLALAWTALLLGLAQARGARPASDRATVPPA